MKHLFTLVLCMIIHCNCQAQLTGKARIDSLSTSLANANEDTSKVKTLNSLAYEFRSKDPETCIRYATEALALATKLKFPVGIGASHIAIGTAAIAMGKFDEGLEHLEKAKSFFENTGDKQRESLVFNNIGMAYQAKGDYSEALINYTKALELRKEIDFKNGIAGSYNNIAIIHSNLGNYQEAIKNLFEALSIREAINDKQGCAIVLMNISSTYGLQKNYIEEEKYLKQALSLFIELDEKNNIAIAYNNLGNIYEVKGNYGESQKSYLRALAIATSLDNPVTIALIKNNLGSQYHILGNNEKALEYFSAAVNLYREVGDFDGLSKSLSDLAELCVHMGRLDKAEKYLDEALELAIQTSTLDNIAESYDTRVQLDSARGNYKLAFANLKMANMYFDSLINEENTRKLLQAGMQYEYGKKEAVLKAEQASENLLNEKEMQKQKMVRNGFVGGFAIMLIFAGIFFTQRNKIKSGKQRSDELLLNILPSEVAEELKEKGSTEAKLFDDVTVMFTDFKDFTRISERLTPSALVSEIHSCFKAFDEIIGRHNIEKIKTIGDSYMCAGGLPVVNNTNASDVVNAAMEIQKFMLLRATQLKSEGNESFEIRIGIHTGPVVAGIVGVKKFAYDIWGDTVNIASRMESSGETGKVNISGNTYELVKDKFNCMHRGKILAKNKGEIEMYFVEQNEGHS